MIAEAVFDISIFDSNNEKVHGPFVLTMGYDQAKHNANNIAVYYYDEEQGRWVKQDSTVNKEEGTVTVEVDHFSVYGVFAESGTSSDPGESESEKPQLEDQAMNDDDVTINDNEVIIDDSEADSRLPSTATNNFNLIAIGLVILVLGGITFIVTRRKVL